MRGWNQRLRDESTAFLAVMTTLGVVFVFHGIFGLVTGGPGGVLWFPIVQLVLGLLYVAMFVTVAIRRRRRRDAPANRL